MIAVKSQGAAPAQTKFRGGLRPLQNLKGARIRGGSPLPAFGRQGRRAQPPGVWRGLSNPGHDGTDCLSQYHKISKAQPVASAQVKYNMSKYVIPSDVATPVPRPAWLQLPDQSLD